MNINPEEMIDNYRKEKKAIEKMGTVDNPYEYHGDVRPYDIQQLINEFGPDITLKDVLDRVKGKYIYKCPKCNGKGTISVKYNAYPSGLPDSGWVDDWKYKDVKCDLCNGKGYTAIKYRIRMVQDGYEPDEN